MDLTGKVNGFLRMKALFTHFGRFPALKEKRNNMMLLHILYSNMLTDLPYCT